MPAEKQPGYSPDYQPQKRALHQRARRAIEAEGRPLICEGCGSNIRLEIHHINRDVGDNSLDNLEVLCRPCHMEEHGHESAADHRGPSASPNVPVISETPQACAPSEAV